MSLDVSRIVTDQKLKRIPFEPESDFYPGLVQAILPCLGVLDSSVSDRFSAQKILNERLALPFSEEESYVLATGLTALSNTKRFADSIFIPPDCGEDTGAHSIQSVILWHELCRQAGWLDLKIRPSSTVNKQRVAISLGLELHDWGEQFIELNTLDGRIARSVPNKHEIENEIFQWTLLNILNLVVRKNGSASDYYRLVDQKRLELKEALHTQELPKFLGGLVQERDRIRFSTWSRSSRAVGAKIYNRFRAAFELIEKGANSGISNEQQFISLTGKLTEHLQGSRHFARKCNKDPNTSPIRLFSNSPIYNLSKSSSLDLSIPYNLSESGRINGFLRYSELELPAIFRLAGSDMHRRMARTLRNAVYLTEIEVLNIGPQIIDISQCGISQKVQRMSRNLLDSTRPISARRSTMRALEQTLKANQERLLGYHRAILSEGGTATTYPFMAKEDLMQLYYNAIQHDFVPQVATSKSEGSSPCAIALNRSWWDLLPTTSKFNPNSLRGK